MLHRDLKLGNVFMGNNMQLKIGDFGLATELKKGERRKSFCGTPNYMAPEVVLNNHKIGGGQGQEYGLGVDVWALGLFMYNFIEGKNPFHNGDITRTYNRIIKGDFDFTSDQVRWLNGRPSVSKEAKDLISRILKVNPAERLTFDQIM